MTTEMTVEKKIIGISKTRNIRESIEIIMNTHMKTGTTRRIIEMVTKTKTEIKTKTNTEMTVMTKLEVGLKKKITYMMMMIYLIQKLEEWTKILQMTSQEKEMAIGFMLAFSENPDKILDSIHSQADVECLIAKRNEFAKNQKAEKLAKDQHENISNTNSQSSMKPVNCKPIHSDTSLTQDLQETVESIQSVSIVTTIIEGKVDDYPIQLSVTSPYEENIQNIDIYDVVEIQDIPTRITDDQVIEEIYVRRRRDRFSGG